MTRFSTAEAQVMAGAGKWTTGCMVLVLSSGCLRLDLDLGPALGKALTEPVGDAAGRTIELAYAREIAPPPPAVRTASDAPPSDAIVLFDGTSRQHFLDKHGKACDWPVEDGALVSTRNGGRSRHIVSRLHFRDAQIHVEFNVPVTGRKGGGAGNSGVYIHGLFELQILDSWDNPTRPIEMVGAIYGIAPPRVLAARPPGQWQVYDIIYIAPRRDEAGNVTKPGSITALLNGVLVQHNVEITKTVSTFHPYRYQSTPYLQKVHASLKRTEAGPVFLQDHDNPVRFRNVWVRPLDGKARVFTGDD